MGKYSRVGYDVTRNRGGQRGLVLDSKVQSCSQTKKGFEVLSETKPNTELMLDARLVRNPDALSPVGWCLQDGDGISTVPTPEREYQKC